MKKQLLHFIIFAFALITTTAQAQQPGSLDASFNGKGIKTVSFLSNINNDNVTASFVQPDGKLLVAITSIGSKGTFDDTTSYIARFMPDGKEDLSFGTNGKKEMDANFLFGGAAYFIPYVIALQSDGMIILGGTRRNSNSNYPCIVSLKSDGSFNELFGNGAANYVFSQQNNSIFTVQVHPKTGNIWASGGSPNYSYSSFFTCALTRTGQTYSISNSTMDGGVVYDNTFGEASLGYEYATSSVIKGDIFYIGGTLRSFDNNKHFSVMAIDVTTGFKSTDFFKGNKGTGTVIMSLPPEVSNQNDNECSALRFAPDSNSLFLAGSTIEKSDALNVNFMVGKINLKNGGYIDNTFSGNGTTIYRMAGTDQNYARSLEIEPNGKMMLAGTLTNSLSYWTVLKLLPDGTIDQSFGTAGRKVYDGNKDNSLINSFNVSGLHYNKSSQNYLLVGHYMNLNTANIDGLAKRINNNGDADNSFGTASEKAIWGKDENAFLRDVSVRSDGKMVIVGSSRNPFNAYRDAVAFLNADGSQDKNFGGNGTGVVFLSTVLPALHDVVIVDVEVLSNNKILVAGHQKDIMNTADSSDFFVVRLNENGSVDNSFGTGGFVTKGFNISNDILQGMALQGDDILLYGYGKKPIGDSIRLGIMRISSTGVFDASFGTGGFYFFPEIKNSPDADVLGKDCDVKVQQDGKIVGANYKLNGSDNYDMAVFRLSKDGIIETAFGGKGDGIFLGDRGNFANEAARAIYIDADDKIYAGGYSITASQKDYTILRLMPDGTRDTKFGKSGWAVVDKGFSDEVVTYLTVNDSKIVACGYYLVNSKLYITSLRFTAEGALDYSYEGRGYHQLSEGFSVNATIKDNKLYLAGADRKFDGRNTYNGLVIKINLGNGPLIKITNLMVSDYNKNLGDEPFLLMPVSNSPAEKSYSISSTGAGCVSVNPTSGYVTMICATVNTSPVIVRVIQPAINGFTADTAYSKINVAKGIPRIAFNSQGDTLNSTFTLRVFSNSEAYPQFSVVGGNANAIILNGDGTAYTNAEGCTDIQAYFIETNNYYAGYATTSICGYTVLVPPAAFDDNVDLEYPVSNKVSIFPLTNDEAYTGTISPSGLDLDPSVAGVQHTYVSPALGRFDADTTLGTVTYTSFQGFVGKGSIDYIVYDSKGSASAVAKININVISLVDIPSLKATELFTPNEDGLNDAFVIGFVNLEKENQLKIFDRNGAELFTKNNYNNDWKGELSNGKTAENGIYYYVFKENDGDKTRELKGVVELKK